MGPGSQRDSTFSIGRFTLVVGTVLTKTRTFDLLMRLLQYATTTQDRENQNGRKFSPNVK